MSDYGNYSKTPLEDKIMGEITEEEEQQNNNENKSDSKQTIPELLINLTESLGCKIYLDQESEPVITFPEKTIFAFPIKSIEFQRWLSGKYYAKFHQGIAKEPLNIVISTLEGKAYHEGNKIKLFNRIAKENNVLYYDLGDGEKVVRIDENGWEITTNCLVKFRRFKHQLSQIEPKKDGKLSEVLKYININDQNEQLLFLTYLVAVFIPDIPRPILIHTGDQGAAKSTAMRVARNLIDPSRAELLIPPSDIPELALAANHHYCLYLDNLSYLSDQFSDVLCRLVTGIGFTKRKLYTDNEDILLHQIVAIGITGITQVATKPDLLDRSLILRFQRIPDEERKDEGDFWKNFYKEKPFILGAIFTALSETLKVLPKIKLNHKPRMADYAKYSAAASIALGSSAEALLSALTENTSRQNNAAIESSPVARVILDFMADKEEWEGSSSQLHKLLKTLAEEASLEIGGKNGFPKASTWLWKKIQLIRPNLIALGVYAYHDENTKSSTIKLTKHSPEKKNAANTATEPENTASDSIDTATKNSDVAIDTVIVNPLTNEPEFKNTPSINGTMAAMATDKQTLSKQVTIQHEEAHKASLLNDEELTIKEKDSRSKLSSLYKDSPNYEKFYYEQFALRSEGEKRGLWNFVPSPNE